MAAGNTATFLRVSGQLVKDPTTDPLSDAAPHGGTLLGKHALTIARPQQRTFNVEAEEYGGEVVEVLYGRQSLVLGAVMRGYDADLVQALFRGNTAAGTVSQVPLVAYPGADLEGELGSDRAYKLLVSPNNPDSEPALYLPRAVPLLDEAAKLQFEFGKELVFAGMWLALRDASGVMYRFGRLPDISL